MYSVVRVLMGLYMVHCAEINAGTGTQPSSLFIFLCTHIHIPHNCNPFPTHPQMAPAYALVSPVDQKNKCPNADDWKQVNSMNRYSNHLVDHNPK